MEENKKETALEEQLTVVTFENWNPIRIKVVFPIF